MNSLRRLRLFFLAGVLITGIGLLLACQSAGLMGVVFGGAFTRVITHSRTPATPGTKTATFILRTVTRLTATSTPLGTAILTITYSPTKTWTPIGWHPPTQTPTITMTWDPNQPTLTPTHTRTLTRTPYFYRTDTKTEVSSPGPIRCYLPFIYCTGYPVP